VADYVPENVHLVGSLALDSVQDVFSTTGTLLGRRLRRVPDGEPGGRRMWISWQYPLLRTNAYLAVNPQPPSMATGFHLLQLAEGVKPDEIRFGELGYAREARASYLDFLAAKKAGQLAPETKFQVCLPTPLAVIGAFCRGKDMLAIEGAYEKAMIKEAGAIAAAIPHEDLCVQWDVCNEMVMWDGQLNAFTPPWPDLQGEITRRLARLAAAVPVDVELGIHLCYGDLDAKHFVEPLDSSRMVELSNALSAAIARPIAYVHMPVPINRSDEDFYKPLAGLKLKPGTELYLGLVHADGADATRKRIAIAHKYAPSFGIATECGIARQRKPDLVVEILKIHAESSREPTRV
jgi:hypothetical protein